MLQGDVYAAPSSVYPGSAALAMQMKLIANALNADILILIHWDAKNNQASYRSSFPETISDLQIADLHPLLDVLQAARAKHSTKNSTQVFPLLLNPSLAPHQLSTRERQTQMHRADTLSVQATQQSTFAIPSHPKNTIDTYANHIYGCIVAENAQDFDCLLIGMPQPLLPHQITWLDVCITAIKQHMAMEHEIQCQQTKVMLLEQVIQWTSHQARQPLSLIELYADVLMDSTAEGTVRSHVTQLHSAAIDLGQHINQLTECGLQKKLKPEQNTLSSIWIESLNRVRPWIHEKHLQIVNSSHPVKLWCDRWQLGQVFDNLLHNAIHFSPEGSTITCHWNRFEGEVLVEITDQGPGISENDTQKVFMPFYSKRQGGTGIGLAIVRKIVLDHQGQCWVQNLPDRGAKFSFTLKC